MTRTETELRLSERLHRLADHAATEPTTAVDDHSLVELTLPPTPYRSRVPATIAASVLILGVIGSVVVVADETGSDGRTRPAVSATGPTADASFDQGATPPDVELAGWTKTYAQTALVPPPPTGNDLYFVLVDDARLFEGPRIKVGITAPPMSFSAGRAAAPVDINGISGAVGTAPDKVYVTWSPAPSRVVYVDGTRATTAQVLEVARGLRLAPDLSSATAGAVPEGLRVAPAAVVSTSPTAATEFKFERDGALFQVNLYAGGRDTFEQRLGDPAHNVTVRGVQGAISTEDGKHFRLDFPNGRWAVEIGGGPFADEQAFLDAVAALQITPGK